eukprot:TRINITY_DN31351_c1_g2_i2.p1 TRINITY_DN31351_c1_g2~~TRINITY_DN31351_c1_g2_i2.p1  ORF type:complete len:297 (-),score=58.84 TRINITY_DN31351_c1_g2_i2:146-1036(-)
MSRNRDGTLAVQGGDASSSSKKKEFQFGAHIGNPQELALRLHSKWNGQKSIDALKIKLKDYEVRFGVLEESMKYAGEKEMQILQKVVEDGEGVMQMQPSEHATMNVIKKGMRDYIDFALDELGRQIKDTSTGEDSGFDWRLNGNPDDNPALRQSSVVYQTADFVSNPKDKSPATTASSAFRSTKDSNAFKVSHNSFNKSFNKSGHKQNLPGQVPPGGGLHLELDRADYWDALTHEVHAQRNAIAAAQNNTFGGTRNSMTSWAGSTNSMGRTNAGGSQSFSYGMQPTKEHPARFSVC